VTDTGIVVEANVLELYKAERGHFQDMIRVKYNLKVVVGTHPIPQKYFVIHSTLGTWETPELAELINPTLASEKLRLLYD